MSLFIMLTRLTSEEVKPSFTIRQKEQLVMTKVRKACPHVKWIADYALMGPYDYLDVIEAPDVETAMKVSAMVRALVGAHTELWPATDWARHNELMRDVAECMDASVAA